MADLRPAAEIPPDVQKRGQADVQPVAADAPEFWWYCLTEDHPGAPTYSSQPLSLARIFGSDSDQGCPICPQCQRQVSAVPCAGPRIPPAQIVDYARRYGESQITGGIGR